MKLVLGVGCFFINLKYVKVVLELGRDRVNMFKYVGESVCIVINGFWFFGRRGSYRRYVFVLLDYIRMWLEIEVK